MKVNDAIPGAIFLAIAILAFVHAGTFATMPGVTFGPDLFPRLILSLMGLGGAILVVKGVRDLGRRPFLLLDDWARAPRSYLIFFAVVGAALAYIVLAPELGFLLTAAVVLFALLLATRGARRAPSSGLVALVVTVGLYVLFVRVLRVPLPYGIVEAWLVG